MIIIIIIVSLVDVNFDHIDFEIVPLMDGHIVCQWQNYIINDQNSDHLCNFISVVDTYY